MEKPILTLSTKDFLTGVAPHAHSERGGLFYKADGISPIVDAASYTNDELGLLAAGASNTDRTGAVVVDTITCGVTYAPDASTQKFFMMGDAGHFYDMNLSTTATPTDLRSGTPITAASNGMVIFQPRGGTKYLYYWQDQQIGRWDLSGVYASGWTDNWATGLTNTPHHQAHQMFDEVYYGNGYKLGQIKDDGASGVSHSTNVLDVDQNFTITALSDDGVYLVIAVTENDGNSIPFSRTKILFWDKVSSSWNREYDIPESFIVSMKRIGNTVYALGARGIYEVGFNTGAKKVLQEGFSDGYTPSISFPQAMDTFNMGALTYAGADDNGKVRVSFFGKSDNDAPSALHRPVWENVSSIVSFVSSLSRPGFLIWATTTPKLYTTQLASDTRITGVSAQTKYIPMPTRMTIDRIDVVFGEPLGSGDELNIDVKSDEDTGATDYGTASFSADGAIRRKSFFIPFECENLSLVINFVGGAVKIKKIEVYATPHTP